MIEYPYKVIKYERVMEEILRCEDGDKIHLTQDIVITISKATKPRFVTEVQNDDEDLIEKEKKYLDNKMNPPSVRVANILKGKQI